MRERKISPIEKQEPCTQAKASIARLLLALLSLLLFLTLSACRTRQESKEHHQEKVQEQAVKHSQIDLRLDERAWEEVCIEELNLSWDSINPQSIRLVKRRKTSLKDSHQQALLRDSSQMQRKHSQEIIQYKERKDKNLPWSYYFLGLSLCIVLLLYLRYYQQKH